MARTNTSKTRPASSNTTTASKIAEIEKRIRAAAAGRVRGSQEIKDLAERMPTKYLRDFFAEKEIPEVSWTLEAANGDEHHITNVVVVEHMTLMGREEAEKVRAVLVRIDFANGDVNHFLRHLAGAVVENYYR